MSERPIEIYELEMALRKTVRPTAETASHATLRDFGLANQLQAMADDVDSKRSKAAALRAAADELDAAANATEAHRSDLMRTGLDGLTRPPSTGGGEKP